MTVLSLRVNILYPLRAEELFTNIFSSEFEKVEQLKGEGVQVHSRDPDGLKDLGKYSAGKC